MATINESVSESLNMTDFINQAWNQYRYLLLYVENLLGAPTPSNAYIYVHGYGGGGASDLLPITMTSDTAPSPFRVTPYTYPASTESWKLFDSNSSSTPGIAAGPKYVVIDLGKNYLIDRIRFSLCAYAILRVYTANQVNEEFSNEFSNEFTTLSSAGTVWTFKTSAGVTPITYQDITLTLPVTSWDGDESLALAGVASNSMTVYSFPITENINLSQAQSIFLRQYRELTDDSFTFSDVVRGSLVGKIIESLIFSESIDTQFAIRVIESLSLSATALNSLNTQVDVAESLSFADLVPTIFELLVTENVTFADVVNGDMDQIVRIVESLLMTSTATSTARISEAIAEVLAILDLAGTGQGATVLEQVAMTDSYAAMIRNVAAIIEDAIFADTVSTDGLRIYASIDESFLLVDDSSVLARMQAALSDGFTFLVKIKIAGLDYIGVVMNTANMAVSEYTGYAFNSIAKIGNSYYGASDTGLYELTGDTDAGDVIAATVRTGVSKFGTDLRKQVDKAYLGFRNDGAVYLKTIDSENRARLYPLTRTDDYARIDRIKLHKGIKSSYWSFEFSNVDENGDGGADFELDSLEFFPIILNRKVWKK